MPWRGPREPGEFPTLGYQVADYIEAGCAIPDGDQAGEPFILTDEQLRFLLWHYRLHPDAVVVPGKPSAPFVFRRSQLVRSQKWGKALALDTPVPTPTGWSTMADLNVGGQVFDERGEPCTVVAKSPTWTDTDCYRVAFSDGAVFVASGDHLWSVDERTSSSAYEPRVVATRDLVGRLTDSGGARRYRVRNTQPLCTEDADLPVEPYVLGAWLGDGETGGGRLTDIDRGVFDEIELAGYRVRQHNPKRWGVYGLKADLARAGVLGNKHIPAIYLRASEKQRWSLLQGLMDTDGHCDARGRLEFTTTKPDLRDGVRELLYSLGIKHLCCEGLATLNGRVTGPKWRISFALRCDTPAFRLGRKNARMLPPGRSHAQFQHRRIMAVERVATVPTVCITVDSPSHLFLAGSEMVPTHNSPLSAAIICAEADGPVLFDGWDADGEPVGRPWATPWIQVTAVSEDQSANVWRALVPMIERGSINADIPDTGETRINLPGGGRIEPVTASARSRLGQRITFALMDQALALDTPLPTPTGWVTMGDVAVGDQLVGSDGLPVEVVKTTTPSDDHRCYRVSFCDGSSLVASAGHLWRTKVSRSAALPRIRTTDEMAEDGRRFQIPRPRPLKTPDVPLPLDPYVLGLWLGDGTTKGSMLTAAEADARFYIDQIHAVGEHATYKVYGDRTGTISMGWNRGRVTNPPSVFQRLRLLGVLENKHIPAVYLRAGLEQRVALVQGLMDTDGCVTEGGYCTFVGTNKVLVEGLVEALRSLGQVASMVWRADHRYTGGGAYKVNFTPVNLVPFRLPRKVERVREAKTRREWVSIKAIEPVPAVPVRCVAVDAPDHLFLAGDGFHVTHNTESWLKRNGGIALADNQRRGLAGMGGRSIETPNAWDPNERSVAQATNEAHLPDVFVDYPTPLKGSIKNKRERRKALAHAYGDSARTPPDGRWRPWVDLDRIDAEVEELVKRGDPGQAERWYLNRILPGADAAFDPEEWAGLALPGQKIPDGELVTLGFDGARRRDSTGIVATDVKTGLQVVVAAWERPAHADEDWEVPETEVNAEMVAAFARWDVWRLYADPPYWTDTVDKWSGRWPKRVVSWWTNRPRPMALALQSYRLSMATDELHHDGNETYATHVANARRQNHPGMVDDEERPLWTIKKDRPDSPNKIDLAMAGCLSWEARGDAIADGALNRRKYRVAGF